MFTAKKGSKSISWDNGEFKGPLAHVANLVTLRSEMVGPPGGPYTYRPDDHLKSPISSAMIMREVLGEGDIEWEGDLPIREEGHDLVQY